MLLASIIQQLYGMVDLAVIGKFVGDAGTVGVSTGGEFIDLLTPFATALATAGQIYIAQLRGANETAKTQKAIGTLCSMMLIASAVFLVMAVAGHRIVLDFLNCPPDAYGQARDYMLITALGMPFIFSYNAICGILRGVGESKRPLIFVTVAAIVNIFADILFVAVFHMEAAGTAIATVLSQLGSFVAALIFMIRRRDAFGLEFKWEFFKPDMDAVRIILQQGVPIFAKTLIIHFAMIWVSANVNLLGMTASATNNIGNKIQKFFNAFTIAVDSACASVIAQNLGARKIERTRKIVLTTLVSCLVMATVFSLISVLFPRQLFGIFTDSAETIELGVTYLRIMVVMYYLSAVGGSLQSIVTGSGFASLSFVIGIMDGLVCRVAISYVLGIVLGMGVIGFFWGTALARTLGCFISFGYFASGKWKTRKLLSER